MQTIYALATPVGGAIAVIRVSGPDAAQTAQEVFTGGLALVQAPRRMAYGRVVERSAAGETRVLDEAMAVFFQGPNSYSGEDMLELYTHGGSAVVESVCALLSAKGLTPARAGEFTQRAFVNGKMDLSQAEAVMDIINAGSRRSADAAMAQLRGALLERVQGLEARVVELLSGIDAALDFPDELEEDVESAVAPELVALTQALDALVMHGLKAKVLREGASVVIAGRPNAGKSSLLNTLLGVDRAIVTEVAGTTRDIIEEQTTFYGVPVRLFDTAGLRQSEDVVEGIGVMRAREAVQAADVLLVAIDGAASLALEDIALLSGEGVRPETPVFALLCKSDLPQRISEETLRTRFEHVPVFSLSALTGAGVDALKRAVAQVVLPEGESTLVTNARHIDALQCAKQALGDAAMALDMDCLATDLRAALLALGTITGSSADEAVIERIFARFCVGK